MNKIFIFLVLVFINFSCSQEKKSNELNSNKNNMNPYEIIVNIPESSWICHYNKTGSFFIAHDEWSIFEINDSWKILREKNIGKYDFEWIVCNQENWTLYTLIENTWNILEIWIDNLELIKEIDLKISKKDRKKYFNNKSWAEGLAINWETIYISTKAEKNNLLEFRFSENKEELIFEKKYNVSSNDLSWMTFHNNILHIISDKNDSLYTYDLENEKITETIKLESWNWEGIVFNKTWELFLADDTWNIVKYILDT